MLRLNNSRSSNISPEILFPNSREKLHYFKCFIAECPTKSTHHWRSPLHRGYAHRMQSAANRMQQIRESEELYDERKIDTTFYFLCIYNFSLFDHFWWRVDQAKWISMCQIRREAVKWNWVIISHVSTCSIISFSENNKTNELPCSEYVAVNQVVSSPRCSRSILWSKQKW